MKIIRPIRREDLRGFEEIARSTGIGMTSIPKKREGLEPLIEQSIASFEKSIQKPESESYLFVLEDLETKKIGGVCGVYSKTGVDEPVYFYRLDSLSLPKTHFPIPHSFVVLNPVKRQKGPSELYSLYLMPQFRKGGFGKLLSFSRFLFIATFPERFDERIYAEVRGYIDEKNESPFWNGLGRYFLNLTFAELNTYLDGRRNFFQEGLPKFPIYKMLLSKQAQNVIQKTHKNSKIALKILLEEGFNVSNLVNPIDAGPIVEASVDSIRSVRESQIARIKEILGSFAHLKMALISNGRLDYRCCYGKIKELKDGQVSVDRETAEALKVQEGDHLRYIFL